MNGVSSSGKSSLAKELSLKLDNYFHLSLDDFDYVIEKMEDRKNGKLIPISTELFFHDMIKRFSDRGVDLIVDHILHNQETKDDCFFALDNYPVLFVGVHCPIKELERREIDRGDRIVNALL